MALSGTFQNLPNGNFGVVCEWSGVQDIANNRTAITIDVYLRVWSVQIGSRTGTYDVGGSTGEWSAQALNITSASAYTNKKLGSFTQNVSHNSSGQANNVTLSVTYPYRGTYSGTYYESITASTTVDLNTIPRYATVTQSNTAKTETTATMQWTADATCDYVWYSTNNGSSWTAVGSVNATTGSYTISGLSANTVYTVKTRIRRKDSQLTTDSSALGVSTYKFPYVTATPNFTIGNSVTISIYNPLSRSCTVEMQSSNGTAMGSVTTSTTTAKGFNTTAIVDALYASIPSAQSGTYKIKVTYSGQSSTSTGGTYTVSESVCSPAYGAFVYQDNNSTTTAVTGNDQKIVRNKSTVRFTVGGVSGRKSATISSARLSVNGATYNMTISGTNATYGSPTIDSGTNVTATVTITDSRGLTAQTSVTVQMYDYSLPTGLITLRRQDGFYSDTTIKCDARYASLGNTNTITITYACTKDGDSSASVSGSLTDNVAVTKTLDNNYGWTVSITLRDALNGTTTYNTYLPRGTPLVFFDKKRNSVGFNIISQHNNMVEMSSDMSLVVNGQNNIMHVLPTSWTANANNGTNGYMRIATITNTGTYQNQMIELEVIRRYDVTPVHLYVNFETVNSTDPALSSFRYWSAGGTWANRVRAFIKKVTTSTWDVYIEKNGGTDYASVRVVTGLFAQDRMTITYTSDFQSDILSGSTMATPVPLLLNVGGQSPMVRFNVSGNSSKTITFSSECAVLVSCTGWSATLRSGLYFISGYSDSSRADITTVKSATGITITAVSNALAWTIANTQGTTADITVLSLWGELPTVT